MAIDFDDDYENFDDDDGTEDLDEEHDDDDVDLDDHEHDDDDLDPIADEDLDMMHPDESNEKYVPPAPRNLSYVRSAQLRSGGLWPCGVHNCHCLKYEGTAIDGYTCNSCTHLYESHLNGSY